jgi:hypothetical protein
LHHPDELVTKKAGCVPDSRHSPDYLDRFRDQAVPLRRPSSR